MTGSQQPAVASQQRASVARWFWPTVAMGLLYFGLRTGGNLWLAILGFIVLILWAGVLLNHRKDRALRAAPSGSVRVETIKQQWVNQNVAQYTAAGWDVVQQSSAKSLGSQARVTITFRKR